MVVLLFGYCGCCGFIVVGYGCIVVVFACNTDGLLIYYSGLGEVVPSYTSLENLRIVPLGEKAVQIACGK